MSANCPPSPPGDITPRSQRQYCPHPGLHTARAGPQVGQHSEAPGWPLPPPCAGYRIHYTNVWNGSQADQAQWLNAKLREAEGDYIFNALVATGAVPITTRGYTAVFGPQHALEHVSGQNIGTFKTPNMRG